MFCVQMLGYGCAHLDDIVMNAQTHIHSTYEQTRAHTRRFPTKIYGRFLPPSSQQFWPTPLNFMRLLTPPLRPLTPPSGFTSASVDPYPTLLLQIPTTSSLPDSTINPPYFFRVSRCVLASLYESVSVRPSVRPCVRPLAFWKMRYIAY